ncbi:MAG: GTP cyclohydrolase I FolE [Anaerolineales bacterium]|nr:GTP cyclohydrolase I FolE [Anaerolineales bacterium]
MAGERPEARLAKLADRQEGIQSNAELIRSAVQDFITAIGEDPDRQGISGTPERMVKAVGEFFSGYTDSLENLVNGALIPADSAELVVVKNIEFFSTCEHHLIPFFGHAHVAFIPNKHVIGLSRIPQVIDFFGRRLQIQERLTRQVAEFLNELIKPKGIMVIMEARHLCASMRGVRIQDAMLVTASSIGILKNDRELFRAMISSNKNG